MDVIIKKNDSHVCVVANPMYVRDTYLGHHDLRWMFGLKLPDTRCSCLSREHLLYTPKSLEAIQARGNLRVWYKQSERVYFIDYLGHPQSLVRPK